MLNRISRFNKSRDDRSGTPAARPAFGHDSLELVDNLAFVVTLRESLAFLAILARTLDKRTDFEIKLESIERVFYYFFHENLLVSVLRFEFEAVPFAL